MIQKFEKLKTLLKELFQLDQPDLDFGLYRVMHAKNAEVSQFLDYGLLLQVRAAFDQYRTADKAELEKELARVTAGILVARMNPDDSSRVQELRAQLKSAAVDIGRLESEVYDHLYTFFRRYYSDGDFVAKRVYKPGIYAIPYEGEEITLYWANKNQYYIKTSEYLRDYAFRLRPDDEDKPMRVHFRLIDAAEGEHGNVKAADGKDRVFILAPAGESGRDFIVEKTGAQGSELVIRFEYRRATLADWPDDERSGKRKPPSQKNLIEIAARRVLAVNDGGLAPWLAELTELHVIANGEQTDYTKLNTHLRRYTARNTFDYFIHKDLGGFLRRELDFYVKNEVMHLDDVENESASRIEQYLSKIKVIRKIASKIIDFLAQLEDFQKKLWLKKKFVVETQYCIRVGSIPEVFYPQIAANAAQQREWVELLAVDEITGDLTTLGYSKELKPDFLKRNPTLVVDTRHFGVDFTAQLLEAIGKVDEHTDGVLFHSDNFQALSIMQEKYRRQVKCIYIDPPYNTDASAIAYKNDYKDSSWLALIENRLVKSQVCLRRDGITCVAIDDTEFARLKCLVDEVYSPSAVMGVAAVRSNPAGRSTPKGFAEAHEYALFVAATPAARVGRLPRTEQQRSRYNKRDQIGPFEWVNFRKHGGREAAREARPRMFYPIFAASDGTVRLPRLEWHASSESWRMCEAPKEGEVAVWPIRASGQELRWKWGSESFVARIHDFCARPDRSRNTGIYMKSRMDEEGMLPVTWWGKKEYSATEYGTNLIANMFGRMGDFSFPKAPKLVEDCLRAASVEENSLILDFFAGSGTTAHAVTNLNREDGGQRKFVLVETGDYFDTVLLPRIKKVIFTPKWEGGKTKRFATSEEAERSPRIVKVVRLESYEDTLNNLEIRRTENQQLLLDHDDAQGPGGLREQYILRYMLDIETRGSQSLLNVQAFTDPTAYKLKAKLAGSDESREVHVDLLETFNWLIGLTIQHIAAPQTFCALFERDSEKRLRLKGRLKQEVNGRWWFRTVTGMAHDGRRSLIIWRKLTGEPEQDNLVLDDWFTKKGYLAKGSEFDVIYVNGSNNLEHLKTHDDLWKVRLIEEDFHRLMFEMDRI